MRFVSFLVHTLWIFVFLAALEDNSQAAEFRRGENVDISGQFTDLLFLSGQRIQSSVQSSNDLIMAGGTVSQSGGTAENLFAAGGNVDLLNSKVRLGVIAGGNLTISQVQTNDLILAGGRIRVDQSQIQNNILLAGGQIEIGRDTVVRNSTVLAGREINFAGTADGNVDISGGVVRLTGKFGKDVHVRAQEVIVGPDVQIAGNFIHGADKVSISPTAAIHGRNEPLPLAETEAAQGPSRAAAVFVGILFLLGTLLAPSLVATIFPRFVQGGYDHLRLRFWETVGKGTVALILAPVFLILLFWSVIGVPIALFAIPFFGVAALTAWSIAVFAVGQQLRIWILRGQRSRLVNQRPLLRGQILGWTLLGALVLTMALFIPVIGVVFCLILFLAGLGAIYDQMRGTPATPRTTPEMRSERSGDLTPIGTPT